MSRVLRIGTRGSALALVQARWVEARLAERGVASELEVIRTQGDDRPPETAWGEGAFVTAIERGLLDGRIDVAVHSAKDLPTAEDPRLTVAAFPAREDPRDALVCRVRGTSLETLPPGARVGTDSPRRTVFLRERRPDLRMHALSGNVDTRLAKLDAGESDALVLAVAGLTRLGRADRIDAVLPTELAAPAPGQGALAVQVRADDREAVEAVATLDDAATRAAVEAERAFLRATGGGCRSPIGAIGRVEDGTLILSAAAAREPSAADRGPSARHRASAGWSAGGDATGEAPTGGGVAVGASQVIRLELRGPVDQRLGLATELAARIVARRTRPRVLVTRPAEQAARLIGALAAAGIESSVVPTIGIRAAPDAVAIRDAVSTAAADDARIVVTSANGARAVLEAVERAGLAPVALRWIAVGEATAAVLSTAGARSIERPVRSSGAGIAAELPVAVGDRLLLARGDLADGSLPAALRDRGATVSEVVAYRTEEAPETARDPLARALDEGPIDAVVCTSPSTVRGLLALAPDGRRASLLGTPIVCIGPTTAAAAREARFHTVVEAPTSRAVALAETVAQVLGRGPGAGGTLDERGSADDRRPADVHEGTDAVQSPDPDAAAMRGPR